MIDGTNPDDLGPAGGFSMSAAIEAVFPGQPEAVEGFRDFRRHVRNQAAGLDPALVCDIRVDGSRSRTLEERELWVHGTDVITGGVDLGRLPAAIVDKSPKTPAFATVHEGASRVIDVVVDFDVHDQKAGWEITSRLRGLLETPEVVRPTGAVRAPAAAAGRAEWFYRVTATQSRPNDAPGKEYPDDVLLAGDDPFDWRLQRLKKAEVIIALVSSESVAELHHSDKCKDWLAPADGPPTPKQRVIVSWLNEVQCGLRGGHPLSAFARWPEGQTYEVERQAARGKSFVQRLADEITSPERLSQGTTGDPRDPTSEDRLPPMAGSDDGEGEDSPCQPSEVADLRPPDVQDHGAVPAPGQLRGMSKGPTTSQDSNVEVQAALMDWAADPDDAPYLVILGDTGMGKTTASAEFQRRFTELHRAAGTPQCIYFDLRKAGTLDRDNPPTLKVLVERLVTIAGGSTVAPNTTLDTIQNLVRSHGAIVIFDGLDEMLVHFRDGAGRRLMQELLTLLPVAVVFPNGIAPKRGELTSDEAAEQAARYPRDPSAGRVIFTCRTHFFKEMREQVTFFTQEDRGTAASSAYKSLHLVPWTQAQVRDYLVPRVAGGTGRVDTVMNILGSVHNLSELSARPYTLHLISELVDDLEAKLANDSKIDASSLYEHITKAWLERDVEKRHIDDAFKVTLMERLAAELWSSGRRTLTGDALRDWLGEQVENTPTLRRWAEQNTEPLDLMAHDLRTASFVARPSDRDFEFAHTSLLEYFLARHLLTAVIEDHFEEWAIARPSRESLEFLVEMLGRDHDHWTPQDSKGRFNQWRTRFVPRASELLFQLFLAHPDHPASPTLAGFNLAGASLPGLKVAGGEGGPPLNLATINLAGADLRDSHWLNCSLAYGDLSATNLDRSRWTSCRLTNVKVSQASAVGATFDRCALTQTDLASTRSRRMYIRDASPMAASTPSPADLPFVIGRHSTSRHSALGLETERIDLFSGHNGWVLSVAWSPDGTHLASGSHDRTVRIWDTHTGECTAILTDHNRSVLSVAWSPDGTHLASGSHDRTVRIWDTHTGECTATLTGHNGWVRSVVWSPDGTHLASGSADRTVRIWDADTGECTAILTDHNGSVGSVVWSPDGTHLASGSHDRTVRIWDAHTGECTATLTGHNGWVWSVVWSPDGTHLASGSNDRPVRIWDAHTGECTATLTGHNGWVRSVVWSPDGTHLASGSDDRTVRIWDAHTGECTATLTGHDGWVWSVVWSPDGTHLASGSDDEMVRIWDAHTGECTATLTGHDGSVRSVVWSPDGTHLASGSNDGAVRRMNPRTLAVDWRAVLLADGHSVTFDSDKTITSCTPDAWRWLGWIGTYPGTDIVTRLPAEWLGPLPIHTPQTTRAT